MASELGRGAQVRLDGDERKYARGGTTARLIDNIRSKQALEASGAAPTGNTPDGSLGDGTAADDEVLLPGGDGGFGNASTRDVGTAAGTVAAGDDSRIVAAADLAGVVGVESTGVSVDGSLVVARDPWALAAAVGAISNYSLLIENNASAHIRMQDGFNTHAWGMLVTSAGDFQISSLAGGGAVKLGAGVPVGITGALTLTPVFTAAPPADGTMMFERTSDTVLTIRMRGLDGVLRSAALALA